MAYRPTTEYGSWTSRVSTYSPGPDSDILDYINGGDSEWQALLEASGALKELQDAYREAINEALPGPVTLAGDQFIGPYQPDDDEWDGFPTDEDGNLDIKAIAEGIDLAPLVERFDILTAEDIADRLGSQAANRASAASQAMRRAGVKPFARVQIDGEGQARAVYWAREVDEALAARPGRGSRAGAE
ncbi:hypothetical protein [Streptomyces sp. NPDC060243]|uniref:hypothetical protein n=1 Tax=Streptomyces sp. NPDC060243 TaxID=3347081 RepID=UPI00364AF2A8